MRNVTSLSQLFDTKMRQAINKDEWELLKAGFGAFLHISKAKSHDPFIQITNEVIKLFVYFV